MTVDREDIRFPSGGATCGAWLYRPTGVARPPVVVLGHGLGATREMRLDAFAERFAQAGIAALAFTYRHSGDSGGEPRQLISIRRQLADWDAALAHVETLDGVDPSRVAIWGSSFGGGHAITVAARHPELAAAIAQCPFTDGIAAAMALGPVGTLKLVPPALRDVAAMVRRRDPVPVALAGAPGSGALMATPDALASAEAMMPPGQAFVNETPARIGLAIATHRPGRLTRRVTSPILFCICTRDDIAPPRPALRDALRAPRGEIRTYDTGHFGIYHGEPFEAAVADQTAFLTGHLGDR